MSICKKRGKDIMKPDHTHEEFKMLADRTHYLLGHIIALWFMVLLLHILRICR